jgi:hypothetical protein
LVTKPPQRGSKKAKKQKKAKKKKQAGRKYSSPKNLLNL